MAPLTVRAWPDSTDPRDSHFSILGYAFGMVPPERFWLTTTDAEPPFDRLNDGVMAVVFSDTPPTTTYIQGPAEIILVKTGFAEVQPSPSDHSVHWHLVLDISPPPMYDGDLYVEFPDGITEFEISVSPIGGGPSKIPNPITFSPRNHLATS